jgi:hypothetical protein
MTVHEKHLRYPLGEYDPPARIGSALRAIWIAQIATLPVELRKAVEGLTDVQLGTPYRDGGWTVRQVAHHVADSHLNGFIRVKLGLTESEPHVKGYDHDAWASLADVAATPVEASLAILDGVHGRWVNLLRAVSAEQWSRTIHHPANGVMPLDVVLGLYAWHGRHHVAHITSLRDRMGW